MGIVIVPELKCDLCGSRAVSGSEWRPNSHTGRTKTSRMFAYVRGEFHKLGWRRASARGRKGPKIKRIDVCPQCVEKDRMI